MEENTEDQSNQEFTINQVSQQLGVSSSAIRYYLLRGLVSNVKRNKNRYRVLTPAQLDWLRTMVYFRRAGFTLRDLKSYKALCQRGNDTLSRRKAMITTKIHQVRQDLDKLGQTLDFLEQREELLDEAMQGHVEIYNELI